MSEQLSLKEYRKAPKKYYQKVNFFKRIAATVGGVKPAEILMIGECEYQELYPKYFRDNQSTPMVTIKQCCAKRQVLIYHRECLSKILNRKCTQLFLVSRGYPKDAAVECYIDHLVRRLRGRSFPHEIGVFLGYPLKDVFGYMGLTSLPHTKTKGWCMYGDTSESEKLHTEYRCARQRMCEKLCMVN